MDFNCTYQCFDANQILRASTDITVLPKKRAFGPLFGLTIAAIAITGVFGILLGVLACVMVPQNERKQSCAPF